MVMQEAIKEAETRSARFGGDWYVVNVGGELKVVAPTYFNRYQARVLYDTITKTTDKGKKLSEILSGWQPEGLDFKQMRSTLLDYIGIIKRLNKHNNYILNGIINGMCNAVKHINDYLEDK